MDIEKLNQKANNLSGVRPHFLYGNLLDQMRYIESLNYIKGLDVLDIASGIGWGSFLMSTIAKSVKGIDLSQEAINTSNKYYSNTNISYELGNSKRILSEENLYDAIISFETLEHVENVNIFIEELYRVGKPNALLILSTPNGYCTKLKKDSKPSNPFHLEEYFKDELYKMLEEKWEVVEYKGQYPIKHDSNDVIEYRKWIHDYWYLKNLNDKGSFLFKLYSRIIGKIFNYITEEPAYNHSCRPIAVTEGYEPIAHFLICKSKKQITL